MKLRTAFVLTVLLGAPGSAAAQPAGALEALVRDMRECTTIPDIPARVACYDAAMARDANLAARAPDAPQLPVGEPGTRRVAPPAPRGFGADALPEPASARAARPERERQRMTAMRELRPRSYAFTLADGGEWEFVDEAPLAYDLPRVGETVEVRRGALGSFMLEYAAQPSIRVKRVR